MTLWTVARQARLSVEFFRQEYYSGLPCLPPGDLPNQGIKPRSPALQVDSLRAEPRGIDIYTLLHTEQITKENLLCSIGNSTQFSVMTCMGTKSKKEQIYVYIYIYV